MPTVLRGSLNTILTLTRAWLVNHARIAASLIHVVEDRKRIPHFTGVADLLIQFRGSVADLNNRGRNDCRVLRSLSVVTRTPLAVSDEVYDDDTGLANSAGTPNFAAAVIGEEALLDALQNFQPEDGKGNLYCYAPMYFLSSNEYQRDSVSSLVWIEVESRFAVPIEAPLDQSWQ